MFLFNSRLISRIRILSLYRILHRNWIWFFFFFLLVQVRPKYPDLELLDKCQETYGGGGGSFWSYKNPAGFISASVLLTTTVRLYVNLITRGTPLTLEIFMLVFVCVNVTAFYFYSTPGIKHGTYMKWLLKTCCACIKEIRSFWRKKSD